MMRVVLPLLEDQGAGQLAAALQTNLKELGLKGEEAHEKLLATLRFAEQSLPAELKPLLTPLALHERFIDADDLEPMARQVEDSWTRERIDRFLGALSVAGLVRDRGQPPAALRDAWTRAFVDVMGRVADALTPRPLHEQRVPFYLHEANFHVARDESGRLGMDQEFAALTQSLAAYAQNTRDFATAEALFQQLAEHRRVRVDQKGEAITYHQLGILAGLREQYEESGEWLIKAVVAFRCQRDAALTKQSVQNFMVFYHRATPAQQAKLREIWDQAGLGMFPEDPGLG